MAFNFEVVSKYENQNINLPKRGTKFSAGYDFEVAADTLIPSYQSMFNGNYSTDTAVDLNYVADYTKLHKWKPTLVPTGIKICLDPDEFLQLSVRSSCPLKYWLILANGVGIIDADYYNNPDNEGEIFFQIINLSPFDIVLHKGDKIGQGIILKYGLTEDDIEAEERKGGFGSTDDFPL